MDSDVLKISKNVFKKLFNKEPEIRAIHAGLECGILEGKNPGLDMISFGPTILGAEKEAAGILFGLPAVSFNNFLNDREIGRLHILDI